MVILRMDYFSVCGVNLCLVMKMMESIVVIVVEVIIGLSRICYYDLIWFDFRVMVLS